MGNGPSNSLPRWGAGFGAAAFVPIYVLRPLAAQTGNSPVAGSVFVGYVKHPSITTFYPCRACVRRARGLCQASRLH